MKIYSRVVIDIDSGRIVAEESFDYQGPIARCDLFGSGGDQAEAAESAANVQAQAAKYAADMQYKASQESNQLIREMYQTGRSDLAPWRQTGAMALDLYSGLLGMPSIYDTQLPTAQGAQYPNWLSEGGTAGTTGTPGTTAGANALYGGAGGGTSWGAPTESRWGPVPASVQQYGLYPDASGNLVPVGEGYKGSQTPTFAGMYMGTPVYNIGGRLVTPQGGDYHTLNDYFINKLPQLYERAASEGEGGQAGFTVPSFNPNPMNYGATGAYSPFQGDYGAINWYQDYTGPKTAPGADGGTGGTQYQMGGNALAPYDLSSPSNRINATEWVKQTPGYEFQLQEGLNALDRSAAAKGMLLSGAQQRGVTEYGQNYALGHYNTLMDRLASLAGIGQTSSSQTAQLGQNMATQSGQNTMQAAQLAGQARMAGAQAIGSGYINAANARAQGTANTWNTVGSLLGTGFGIGTMIAPFVSDKRTKEDIEPLNGEAMALVRMLAPVMFRYKAQFGGGPAQPGFIADDLEQILPGAVLKTPAGMKMVNPLPIIAMLVKAVQEQQQQIDALRRN